MMGKAAKQAAPHGIGVAFQVARISFRLPGALNEPGDRDVEDLGKSLCHLLADPATVMLDIADERFGNADFFAQFLLGHIAVLPVDSQVHARRHITLHLAIDIGPEKVDASLVRVLLRKPKFAAELRLKAVQKAGRKVPFDPTATAV